MPTQAYMACRTNQLTGLICSRKTNNSRMYLLIHLQAHQPQIHKFINSQTHELINSSTHELINSRTQKLINLRQFGIRICLEKFQLPSLFNSHGQCLWLILEETVCSQCRTEIHEKVMHGAMAWMDKVRLVFEQFVDAFYYISLTQHHLVPQGQQQEKWVCWAIQHARKSGTACLK